LRSIHRVGSCQKISFTVSGRERFPCGQRDNLSSFENNGVAH
jgi:hypothetical protein